MYIVHQRSGILKLLAHRPSAPTSIALNHTYVSCIDSIDAHSCPHTTNTHALINSIQTLASKRTEHRKVSPWSSRSNERSHHLVNNGGVWSNSEWISFLIGSLELISHWYSNASGCVSDFIQVSLFTWFKFPHFGYLFICFEIWCNVWLVSIF